MSDLRISRIHAPVTVLGPGRRLGIWVQGCSVGCRGCVSRDTWSTEAGTTVPVANLIDHCSKMIADMQLTGITISGGEPFEQPDALGELLDGFKHAKWRADTDVLCYSGFPLKRLQRSHGKVLELIDALIPEPFVQDARDTGNWRGSSNQPLLLLSDLGRRRFSEQDELKSTLQFEVSDKSIWFIGIPKAQDMERLRALVMSKGLSLGDVSWLP